ncbi:hypothetical protein B0H13DRAFT_770894 [Mycena leptocephala]|nr:hypothetical protein B0H13DRAFT_770894 [Mycena leptocephala]
MWLVSRLYNNWTSWRRPPRALCGPLLSRLSFHFGVLLCRSLLTPKMHSSSFCRVPGLGGVFPHLPRAAYVVRTPSDRVGYLQGLSEVFRTWALSVQTVKSTYDYATLSSIVIDHIQSWKGWNPSVPSNLQNLTDGAGGTIDDVAILVVGHIHRVLQIGVDDDEMEPHHIMALLHGLLVFLAEIERPESMHETGNSMVIAGPLARALSARGFVPAVVSLMRALSSPPLVSVQPSSAVTISRCFMLLERILLASKGHRLLPDALEAGLLVALVSCATTDMADSVYRDFMAFLCGILPPP